MTRPLHCLLHRLLHRRLRSLCHHLCHRLLHLPLQLLLGLLVAVGAQGAAAHELSMAEMQLREVAPGQFLLQWATGGEKGDPRADLTPVWPSGCDATEAMLRCGPAGLSGSMSMRGVGDKYSAAMIKVFWQDGQARTYTLTAGQPTVHLLGAADDKRAMGEVAVAYAILGFEHIMGGLDHMAFVLGLLFLVGFRRQLVWTISAFTLGHTVSLASAAFDVLTLRPGPVDVCIALSVMLVASEALGQRKTLAREWPSLVALLFGLVHGMGFAGALKEIGLPENHALVGLLTFNLGVEAGQLLMVAVLWWLLKLAQRFWPEVTRMAPVALYAVGSVGAYWTLSRMWTLVAS